MRDLEKINKHIEEDVIVNRDYSNNPRFHDLSGATFGRLKVLKYAGKDRAGTQYYWCECSCGNKLYVKMPSLTYGNTSSCGCIHKEMMQERLTSHGDTDSRLYHIYYAMIARCKYPNEDYRHLYLDKSIKVCDEWQPENNGYLNFKEWAYNIADPGIQIIMKNIAMNILILIELIVIKIIVLKIVGLLMEKYKLIILVEMSINVIKTMYLH